MLESEKAVSSSSSLELDPLLKDLNEKKLSFRRNVVSLAAELKDVRNRLASQEETFIQETQSRQLAEAKARNLEEEIVTLQNCLNERDYQLKASSSTSEQVCWCKIVHGDNKHKECGLGSGSMQVVGAMVVHGWGRIGLGDDQHRVDLRLGSIVRLVAMLIWVEVINVVGVLDGLRLLRRFWVASN
ncbi:hypothetical protein M5K25_026510 [Dendrobium thyrsiflorum]|uniref:Uncharacterized protein n=1 Tax=Dendrobium thyrsiflorum TaxID=117978 RepID=A0ABD0TXG3_DENTH